MLFVPSLLQHCRFFRVLKFGSSALLCLSLSWCFSFVFADEVTLVRPDCRDDGFVPLSQGDQLAHWNHNGNWEINSGMIYRQDKGGALVYVGSKVPDDFDLRFEWKVNKGSNSVSIIVQLSTSIKFSTMRVTLTARTRVPAQHRYTFAYNPQKI